MKSAAYSLVPGLGPARDFQVTSGVDVVAETGQLGATKIARRY